MPDKTCATCRWWDFCIQVSGVRCGTCHRYPEPTDTNEGHWCGEHKPKVDEAAEVRWLASWHEQLRKREEALDVEP